MPTPSDSENTAPNIDRNTSLSQLRTRLAEYPDLIPLFTQVLDLAEDSLEGAPDAHEVEDQTVELMRKLGGEVLGTWSQKAHDRAREEACRLNESLIVHRKKTSHGTADSESSA